MSDLKRGDRVRTPQGEVGRIASVDGAYVTVDEESGYSWRGRADDCQKMQSMETTMARSVQDLIAEFKRLNRMLADESLSESDANAIRRKRDQVQAEIETAGGPKGYEAKMDLTEVEVAPDGGVSVTADPSGDEAAAGTMSTFGPRERTPEQLARAAKDKNRTPLSRGDAVKVAGMDGSVKFIKADAYNIGNLIVQVNGGDTYTVEQSRVTKMSATLMASSATCPYCAKTVSMHRGVLGHHRVAGGVCDGANRRVASFTASGRAVLMATHGDPKLGHGVKGPGGDVYYPKMVNGTKLYPTWNREGTAITYVSVPE